MGHALAFPPLPSLHGSCMINILFNLYLVFSQQYVQRLSLLGSEFSHLLPVSLVLPRVRGQLQFPLSSTALHSNCANCCFPENLEARKQVSGLVNLKDGHYRKTNPFVSAHVHIKLPFEELYDFLCWKILVHQHPALDPHAFAYDRTGHCDKENVPLCCSLLCLLRTHFHASSRENSRGL